MDSVSTFTTEIVPIPDNHDIIYMVQRWQTFQHNHAPETQDLDLGDDVYLVERNSPEKRLCMDIAYMHVELNAIQRFMDTNQEGDYFDRYEFTIPFFNSAFLAYRALEDRWKQYKWYWQRKDTMFENDAKYYKTSRLLNGAKSKIMVWCRGEQFWRNYMHLILRHVQPSLPAELRTLIIDYI